MRDTETRIVEGRISYVLGPHNLFEVKLADGSCLHAKRNGFLLKNNLSLRVGDLVKIKVLFNQPNLGIIFFREKREGR